MKGSRSVGIIGGADGPTSVWIAGKTKEKNLLRRLRNNIRQWKHRKKRDRVLSDLEKNIADIDRQAHSLKEVCAYMVEKYGAVELSEDDREYQRHLENCKAALVQKHRPDLLGESLDKFCPKDCEDMEALECFMKKVEEYHKMAGAVSLKVFPMDYHYYNIATEDGGRVQVEIELLHNVFLCGYSAKKGKEKQGDAIMKDIYKYYGMMRADFENKTERFHSYLAMMTI